MIVRSIPRKLILRCSVDLARARNKKRSVGQCSRGEQQQTASRLPNNASLDPMSSRAQRQTQRNPTWLGTAPRISARSPMARAARSCLGGAPAREQDPLVAVGPRHRVRPPRPSGWRVRERHWAMRCPVPAGVSVSLTQGTIREMSPHRRSLLVISYDYGAGAPSRSPDGWSRISVSIWCRLHHCRRFRDRQTVTDAAGIGA